MSIFLRKFRLYLINENIPKPSIKQYFRAASIFLCWYHKDISKLTNQDFDEFLRVLIRKKYQKHEIEQYHYTLSTLSHLLHKKISIQQEKKPHHEDEVYFSRCTKSNKKRQSMAGMVN